TVVRYRSLLFSFGAFGISLMSLICNNTPVGPDNTAPYRSAADRPAEGRNDDATERGMIEAVVRGGTEDERVLAFREGMQAEIDAGIFRALRELDGFADQRLIGAVVDLERWKAGQISVEHIDPGIVPGHTCAAEPRLAKPFQHRPGEKRVGLGVAVQRLVLHLYVIPG